MHYVLVDNYMEISIPESDTQRKVTSNGYLIGIKGSKRTFPDKKIELNST
jgi:hypothetical protein